MTSFLELSPEFCNSCVQIISDLFTINWLNDSTGEHRLQQIWRRKDHLSTIQIINFGNALLRMYQIDQKWTMSKVREIKLNDKTAQGHIFEVNCCAMFVDGGMNLIPSSKNQPGYDAHLSLENGRTIFISMKNHEVSARELDYQSECEKFRSNFREFFSKEFSNRQILVQMDKFPTDNWWTLLRDFPRYQSINENSEFELAPGLKVKVGPVKPFLKDFSLSSKYFSDACIIVCTQSENEQKNFLNKLENAVLNMKKNIMPNERHDLMIFMRVHPTADAELLQQYARNFIDKEEKECDVIVIYQPVVTRSKPDTSVSKLLHSISIISRETQESATSTLNLNLPVGIGSQYILSKRLYIDGNESSFSGKYLYQAADQFYNQRLDPTNVNAFLLELKNPGPRMFTHGVLNADVGGEKINWILPSKQAYVQVNGDLVSADFPLSDNLTIV